MHATVCVLCAGQPRLTGDEAKSGQFIGQFLWVKYDPMGIKGLICWNVCNYFTVDLSSYLDVENGLADQMLGIALITDRQHEEIIKTPLRYGKCDKLISAIQQNEKSITVIHNEFLDVLLGMKQDHIIDYILQNDPGTWCDDSILYQDPCVATAPVIFYQQCIFLHSFLIFNELVQ